MSPEDFRATRVGTKASDGVESHTALIPDDRHVLEVHPTS